MRRWSWPIEKEGGRLLEDPTIWLWSIEKEAAQACDNAGGRLLPDNSDIESVTFFEDLNLAREIIDGLYVEMHFSTPTKIQTLTLPMIVTPPYKDLVAQAHNGSGKTTCSVLGVLSRVDPTRKVPQAICICPTRELAQQNHAVLLKMGKYTGITSMCAIPSDSANYIPIIKRPSVTEQVIIGTPGTIKKFTSAKKLSTRDIKILVFDEADHMLAENGFKDDSERIMREIQRDTGGCQELKDLKTKAEAVVTLMERGYRVKGWIGLGSQIENLGVGPLAVR